MDYENGGLKILYFKKSGAYVPVGCLTSNSFSETSEMLDTTTRDNAGWKTATPTNQSYTMSFDGLITQKLSLSGVITYRQIKQLKRNKTLIDWKIEDSVGNIDFGFAYLDSLSDSAEIDTMTSFSGSLNGFGKPLDTVQTIFDAYQESVTVYGGEITGAVCQEDFIGRLSIVI